MRLCALLLILSFAAPSHAAVVQGVGVARDATNGQIRYLEHHQILPNGNYLIDYYAPDLSKLAYKRVSFPELPQHPAIEQEDFTRGSRARVEPGPNAIKMWRDEAGEISKGSIAAADDLIVDAGFDAYIKANWTRFQQPLEHKVDFAVAGSPRTLNMRIKVSRPADSDNIEFKVYPNNWFVRLFLPELDLVYTQDRRLLRYTGYSNLAPVEGEQRAVVIEFTYHETETELQGLPAEWIPTPTVQSATGE